ncbi:MAG: DoxX family protein [Acidimicrobiia bacterium]
MSADALNAGLLALRLVLGIVFVAHGVKHFINREKTINWTASIGFKNPGVQWAFMTFAEIAIGAGLVLGLLTSFAAAGLISMMFVAFWTVHRASGFFVSARPDEGYEYVLVLVVAAFALALIGPGEWSLDDALDIAQTFDEGAGAAIAAGGFVAAIGQLAAFYRPTD